MAFDCSQTWAFQASWHITLNLGAESSLESLDRIAVCVWFFQAHVERMLVLDMTPQMRMDLLHTELGQSVFP